MSNPPPRRKNVEEESFQRLNHDAERLPPKSELSIFDSSFSSAIQKEEVKNYLMEGLIKGLIDIAFGHGDNKNDDESSSQPIDERSRSTWPQVVSGEQDKDEEGVDAMDSSLTLRQLQQPRPSVIFRDSDHLIGNLRICKIPISLRRRRSSKSTSLVSRTSQTITAKKKSIEGVSEELNKIASQDLTHAPTRRRVRSAFADVQQHLDHVLFKMAPPGIRTEEWYETNSRGFEIFCKSWLPKAGIPIKAALCFCHGYGDTCTFFFEGIARRIAASGYGVYAMDYPGFGLSRGLHGYIPSFDGLVDDVIEQYSNIKVRPEIVGLPRFIMGQSMGGAVTLKVHLKQPYEWDGVILVAPMAKIAEDVTPPAPVLKVLSLMSEVTPEAKLFPQKDLAELAFRDPRKRKMAAYNVISYSDQMRLKTAVELLKATHDIESRLEKVSSPLLVLHGAADKVTDPLVSKFLYEKASSKDKTLKLYEDGYHSILEGEPDDRILEVLGDIVSWLDCHCALK